MGSPGDLGGQALLRRDDVIGHLRRQSPLQYDSSPLGGRTAGNNHHYVELIFQPCLKKEGNVDRQPFARLAREFGFCHPICANQRVQNRFQFFPLHGVTENNLTQSFPADTSAPISIRKNDIRAKCLADAIEHIAVAGKQLSGCRIGIEQRSSEQRTESACERRLSRCNSACDSKNRHAPFRFSNPYFDRLLLILRPMRPDIQKLTKT